MANNINPIANQIQNMASSAKEPMTLEPGKIINARVLLQEGENITLKIGTQVLEGKADSLLPKGVDIKLLVEENDLNQILLSLISKNRKGEARYGKSKFDVFISVENEEDVEKLKKMNLKSNDIINAKLFKGKGQRQVMRFSGNDLGVELGSKLKEGGKVKVSLNKDLNFELKDTGATGEKTKKIVMEKQNLQNKPLLSEGDKAMKGTDASTNSKFKGDALVRDTFTKEGSGPKAMIQETKLSSTEKVQVFGERLVKELILKPTDEGKTEIVKIMEKNPETFKGEFELNLNKVSGEKIKGELGDHKFELNPKIDLKDNLTLKLDVDIKNGKMIFKINPELSLENKKALSELVNRLGFMVDENENNPEILNKLMENKLPLSKENISHSQNVLNTIPLEPKMLLDTLMNPDLLFTLLYQFSDSNDSFFMSGSKKQEKNKEGIPGYEFKLLYKSEKLGDILVDFNWYKNLEINFYCESEGTSKRIEEDLEDIKKTLGNINNLEINISYNKERLQEEVEKNKELSISNIDIRA